MKKKLIDICNINNSSLTKNDHCENILYLDTSSIINGNILELQDIKRVNAPSRAQRKVKNDTIIYSLVRPNLKHFGIIKNPKNNFIVSTGFITLDIIDNKKYCADYVYYLLTQTHIINYLQTLAENSVSAYPAITPSDIGNLSFDFPDFETQCKKAQILSLIDTKIKISNAINHNLPILDHSLKEAKVRHAA